MGTGKSILFAALLAGLLLVGILLPVLRRDGDAAEIVVYSGRNENFVLPLIEQFERETGIRVRLLSGNATGLAHRIVEESHAPRADVFLANDAGIMEYVRRQGVLAPIASPLLDNVPSDFRAADASWTGLSGRARVLMYNLDMIGEAEMPQSILDLADPKYRGQFAITRSGNASMVSHIAAIRYVFGDEATTAFLKGVLANQPAITRGHSDIRRMVGSGEVAFGLVNDYYYHQQLHEPRDNRVGAIYPDQEAGRMGVFVNVAGVALLGGAPNSAHAQAFIDFLLAPEQQRQFAAISREVPILEDLAAPPFARGIGEYRRAAVRLDELGAVWADVLDLMERAGYVD